MCILFHSLTLLTLPFSKILRGFETYARNSGQRHPLTPDVVASKRDVGKDPLTDESSQLWMGTISVGTPPV